MNVHQLGTVVRTELAHQVRRPLFVILLVITFLVVWGLSSGNVTIESGASQVGGQKAWVTSEFAVSQTLILLTFLLYTFFVSVGAGMGVISDEEARVGPLLHTTPLTPREYVWGKFLAVLAAYGLALVALVAFLVFFHHAVPAGEDAEYRGPLSLLNYVRPALFFAVPLLVFTAGVAFTVGELTRRPVLVYFLPVVMMFSCAFFLWDWSPGWLDPKVNRLLMALEPAGLRWLSETWVKVDRGVEFYNTQRVGLDALFVLSRLGFIRVAPFVLVWGLLLLPTFALWTCIVLAARWVVDPDVRVLQLRREVAALKL